MTPGDDGNARDFWWGTLAARVLHPVQVEIIEALRWIDQPLSAADLARAFEGQRSCPRVERHLRRLAKLGAAGLGEDGRVRGPMGQRSYRLLTWPKP